MRLCSYSVNFVLSFNESVCLLNDNVKGLIVILYA